MVSAIAPANVTYALDVAQAWADYNVTMTGIGRDMYIASAQLNVAQVNAADPSTFSYIYPQSGSSWAPMMGGVSALPWAYGAAAAILGGLGEPEYAPPPNPPTGSSPSPGGGTSVPSSGTGDWLDAYAGWFNGVFVSGGYSTAAGNLIYDGVVGTGLVDNDTLANATANQLGLVTLGVSIPLGFWNFLGVEAALGVGTGAAIWNFQVINLTVDGTLAATGPSLCEISMFVPAMGLILRTVGLCMVSWKAALYANLPMVAGAISTVVRPVSGTERIELRPFGDR